MWIAGRRSYQFEYDTYNLHVGLPQSEMPKTYSDLMEGFYDSNDLLGIYPYLANIVDVTTELPLSDTVGYPVYVHITEIGTPQLWIEIDANFSSCSMSNFVFGSKNDPAPTYIKMYQDSGNYAGTIHSNPNRTLCATISDDSKILGKTRLVNCMFSSGTFSSRSKESEITFEDCFFIASENQCRITLDQVAVTGTFVCTAENTSILSQGANSVVSIGQMSFENAQFYIGYDVVISSMITFSNSSQMSYIDPVTKVQNFEMNHGINLKLINGGLPDRYMLIANRTKFTSIRAQYDVPTLFDNCVIANSVKLSSPIANNRSCIEIQSSDINNCMIMDTNRESRADLINLRYCNITNTTFSCDLSYFSANMFGVGNKFKGCQLSQAHESRWNQILCNKDGAYPNGGGGIKLHMGVVRELMGRNGGEFDISIIENDDEVIRLCDNMLRFDIFISKLFGGAVYNSMINNIRDELVPAILSYAGREDKTSLTWVVGNFISDHIALSYAKHNRRN